jgi:hypothetical protein
MWVVASYALRFSNTGRKLSRPQISLSRDRVATVHVDEELRVRGEEGHLALAP